LIYIVIVFVTSSLSLIFFRAFFEPLFLTIFKRPLFNHFSLFSKTLSDNDRYFLEREIQFYKRLKPKFKKSFENKILHFLDRYSIIEQDNLTLSQQQKILIAATFSELTFGMNVKLQDSFDKIIVYPTAYFSTMNQDFHKGEFNARHKTIVLSWEDFYHGIKVSNDNINLGIHEFTHAILHQATKPRTKTFDYILFEDEHRKILKLLNDEKYMNSIKDSGFFREYAFTNSKEFISVVMEYFFEDPKSLKTKFPDLYQRLKTMLNYDENCFSH